MLFRLRRCSFGDRFGLCRLLLRGKTLSIKCFSRFYGGLCGFLFCAEETLRREEYVTGRVGDLMDNERVDTVEICFLKLF